MQVKKLEVRLLESYERNAGEYTGAVTLEGERGKLEVKLSPRTIRQLFSIIGADVYKTALHNVGQIEQAVEDATHAPLLVEAANLELPE